MCRQNGILPDKVNFNNLKKSLELILEQDISNLRVQYKSFLKKIDGNDLDKNLNNLGKLNTVNLDQINRMITSLNSEIEELKKAIILAKRVSGQPNVTEIKNNLKKNISNSLSLLHNLGN